MKRGFGKKEAPRWKNISGCCDISGVVEIHQEFFFNFFFSSKVLQELSTTKVHAGRPIASYVSHGKFSGEHDALPKKLQPRTWNTRCFIRRNASDGRWSWDTSGLKMTSNTPSEQFVLPMPLPSLLDPFPTLASRKWVYIVSAIWECVMLWIVADGVLWRHLCRRVTNVWDRSWVLFFEWIQMTW